MYNTELEVAKKAERMLESALRNKVHSLRLHLNMDDRFPSMLDATAESNFTRAQKSSKMKDWNIDKFSRLSITMEKHGYVQNFGIQPGTARSSGKRKSALGKEYNFKSHIYKNGMKEQDYIADAVASSGVVNFVTTEIAGLRGQQILLQMRFLEKI